MAGMTIDELARRAGTTSRNVRAYQERGLLPPPEREGRVGVYGEGHLGRLRLIGGLADRGFSLASIAELLRAWEAGHSIRDVLGLEEAATAVDEPEPVVLTVEDLTAQFGGDGDAAAQARAVELGLIEPVEGGFLVRAPQLIEVGAELAAIGIPLAAVLDEAAALLADADRIAARFVGLFSAHVVDPLLAAGEATDAELREVADKVRAARPLGAKAVDRTVALAMARHLAGALSRVVGSGTTEPAAS